MCRRTTIACGITGTGNVKHIPDYMHAGRGILLDAETRAHAGIHRRGMTFSPADARL